MGRAIFRMTTSYSLLRTSEVAFHSLPCDVNGGPPPTHTAGLMGDRFPCPLAVGSHRFLLIADGRDPTSQAFRSLSKGLVEHWWEYHPLSPKHERRKQAISPYRDCVRRCLMSVTIWRRRIGPGVRLIDGILRVHYIARS